jgi:hypothetical protein
MPGTSSVKTRFALLPAHDDVKNLRPYQLRQHLGMAAGSGRN